MDKLLVCPQSTEGNVVRNADGKDVYLYEVRTSWVEPSTDKRKTAMSLILAESVERAEGQHQCVLGISCYLENTDAKNVESKATRVPFSIQGWSRRVF